MKFRTISPRFTFPLDPACRRHLSTLRLATSLLLALCVFGPVAAQIGKPDAEQPDAGRAVVVAAVTGTGARFAAAFGSVVEMRLEVFSFAGEKVFDSNFRRGSVLDWVVGDGATGQFPLPDDQYLCVVTLRDLSGRLQQRRGITSWRSGSVTLPPPDAAQLSTAQAEAAATSRRSLLIAEDDNDQPLTIFNGDTSSLTVTAHDGQVGQLTSTTGALTFRTGDLFAGNDRERLRITPQGNVGIGTDKPQAMLDVAGSIRATGALWAGAGLEFADGSRLNSADGKLLRTNAIGQPQAPEVDGSGTTGRLTKWTNGPNGTLGDSVVTETSGKLGIGTATPNYEITLFGNDVGLQLISPVTGTTANDGFRFGISSVNNAFLWNTEATDMYFGTSATERMRIKATGNVGIGTSNPTAALDVVGSINASGSVASATASISSTLTVDTNTLHVDATNNRVGIGTTSPSAALDVVGAINASTQYNLDDDRILSNPGVANLFVGVGAGNANSGSSNTFVGSGAGAVNTSGSQNSFFGTSAGAANTTGPNNSFFGRSAGAANTTGSSNSFFGLFAGGLNATGASNSFFGAVAGAENTIGENNSFFGNAAGTANTTGSANSFFGGNAGDSNTNGNSNSFFGHNAGTSNTSGATNSFFGKSAGQLNTTAGGNSFFGYLAGSANSTGSTNSFFGSQAGAVNTTSSNNSFFGNSAGSANTTGSNNSFFGAAAGQNNSTGGSNAFFGQDAGQANTTGPNNAFFGQDAGNANTTGADNSFFGGKAGLFNTTGEGNSFLGRNAGASNTTGGNNSFFGIQSGESNTTAGLNSFFGSFAGQDNTTGPDNSFFGNRAGHANTTGGTNSFFGKDAGDDNTQGGGNTFIGYNSGQSNTTESNNTFIGANSNGAAGLSNATALGANATVTQSDSLVLGSGVKVGMGSSAPAEKLHVVGNVFIGGNPAAGSHGLILKSPNGATCAKLTIDNAGALVTAVIACP